MSDASNVTRVCCCGASISVPAYYSGAKEVTDFEMRHANCLERYWISRGA